MKPPQFIITLILASICLVLSILVFWQGRSGMSLQSEVQKKQIDLQTKVQERQEKINRGNQIQQVGQNLLKDIATLAFSPDGKVKNQKLKDLLERNGITVKVNQPATPSTTPAP